MALVFILIIQFLILAYALVGGVFLAFSDFIMRALAIAPQGDAAMQAINREVFRWIFMTLFLGLAPVSIGLTVYGGFWADGPSGKLIALAGLVYFFGCFGVTVLFNVPMNNALAEIIAGTSEATEYWKATYVPRWTFWKPMPTTRA